MDQMAGMKNGVPNGGFGTMVDPFNALIEESSIKDNERHLFEEARSTNTTLSGRTLVIGNVPTNSTATMVLKQLEKDYGLVQRVFKPKEDSHIYYAFFAKHERAKIAEKGLVDQRFLGNYVKSRICPPNMPLTVTNAIELMGGPHEYEHISGGGDCSEEGRFGRGRPGGMSQGQGRNANMFNNNPADNYPTRLLVNSDIVGAVIGRGGEKIREITVETTARVDVKRELVPWSQFGGHIQPNNQGNHYHQNQDASSREQSQIVFIVGTPEACSHAVKLIMEICHKEAAEHGRHDINLGLLAEDRFCGRVIGRDGKHLNQIKEKTGCVIAISNSPTITALAIEPPVFSLDRIVTIRGSLDGLCQAEKLISGKLRQCHTVESLREGGPAPYGGPNRNNGMYPPVSYPNMYPPNGGGYGPIEHTPYGGMGGGGGGSFGPFGSEMKLDDALYMRIPHVSAGAVIGTDGASIKKIMEESKTYVNVSKVKPDDATSVPPNLPGRQQADISHRLVTIKGPPSCQTRAQWHIFQRVKTSSRQSDVDLPPLDQDIALWTIVRVPKHLAGRIIGKGGKVVNHIQANTGTILNMPPEESSSEFQAVEIYGTFDSTQLALARVRALIRQALQQESGGPAPGGFMGGPRVGGTGGAPLPPFLKGPVHYNHAGMPPNKFYPGGRSRRRSGPPYVQNSNDNSSM